MLKGNVEATIPRQNDQDTGLAVLMLPSGTGIELLGFVTALRENTYPGLDFELQLSIDFTVSSSG